MKKVKFLWVFFLVLAMSACFAAAGTAAFAAEDAGKILVNVGTNALDGAVWVEAGLPDTWMGVPEIIEDDEQADGGDVILRNEVSDNAFQTGEAAFARTSTHPELAAYALNGLEMRFYLAANYGAGEQLKIIFCERSGWYLNSLYAFQIIITKQSEQTASVNVQYKSNDNGEILTAAGGKSDVPLYFDYDYFTDKNGGFVSPQGTQNVIEIKGVEGVLKLFVNGTEIIDMTDIVREVTTNVSEGLYLNFWSQASNGSFAMRITDIEENDLPVFDTGAPNGFSLPSGEAQILHMLDAKGNILMYNREAAGWDFNVQMEQAIDPESLELAFRLETAAAMTFDVRLVNGTELAILFRFAADGNSAELTVYAEQGENLSVLGSGNVPLWRDGRTNRLRFYNAVKYFADVNGENVALENSALESCLAQFEGDAVLQFGVNADAQVSLYGIVASAAETEFVRGVDGYALTNAQAMTEDAPVFFPVQIDRPFGVCYTATQVSVRSFRTEFSLGGYGNSGRFRVILSTDRNTYGADTEAAVILELAMDGGGTTLALYVCGGGAETSLGSVKLDAFEWNFDERHTLAFGRDAEGYAVFLDGVPVLNAGEMQEALDAALVRFDGIAGYMQFTCEGEKVLFSPYLCGSFSEVSERSDWSAGGIGGLMSMGHGGEGDLLWFDGGSAVRTKSQRLDGFHIGFRAWHMHSRVEAYFALGTTQDWYMENTGIVFSLAYIDGETARFNVYDSARGQNDMLVSAELPFHWNNGLHNYIDFRFDGSWIVRLNGVPVDMDAAASEKLALRAQDFAQNIAWLQLWGSSDIVLEMTETSDTAENAAPQASGSIESAVRSMPWGVTVDLDQIFSDADGDALFYRILSGGGRISDGVWSSEEQGEYQVTVLAFDGNGGKCEYTFAVTAENMRGGCGGFIAGSCAGFTIVFLLVSLAFLMHRGARKREKSVEDKLKRKASR